MASDFRLAKVFLKDLVPTTSWEAQVCGPRAPCHWHIRGPWLEPTPCEVVQLPHGLPGKLPAASRCSKNVFRILTNQNGILSIHLSELSVKYYVMLYNHVKPYAFYVTLERCTIRNPIKPCAAAPFLPGRNGSCSELVPQKIHHVFWHLFHSLFHQFNLGTKRWIRTNLFIGKRYLSSILWRKHQH